ncbi:D-alanyl-D-alanine carboxypeptidase family protein [Coprococcus comes]|uniref:D-alanyl-D-alanine carboxypeptidase family protein n=1 Tax=Coprococcus comes TaxID=410072 RepID=UPI001C019728|nr:D-alanyl-D-alanine carboxypeptidase family protein [Coprococcus comes]MBT9780612.1 D-alanyl-D-alanine carboxypeptidase [Coprococcus comes]
MRKFLAGLLGMVLCVQTVYGIQVRAADVFEPGERPKAMQDVIRQEDPEQMNRDNSGNLTGLELSAESAVIMEASGGQVLLEKNADEKKPPASVTKVMTLLLIFDALADGTITPDTEVTTSEYAASMGGSQVFLEAGEKQTVDTMIKCIAVASANDACVAMAEKIAGSEPAFVEKMNQRSAGLGMTNTHFVNCNGLDTEGHLTTARDIALMSRELITKYPQIEDYSTIWMENITHTTAKGSSEFGLSNTNKLIRQYEYATGLKTGSTSGAKFCLSATARKDGVNMIAVVMAEPDSKTRIKDAIAMLNYGFGKCSIYQDEKALEKIVYAEVKHGMQEKAKGETLEGFRYVDTSGSDLSAVEKEVQIQKQTAPVKKGDQIGEVIYRLNEKTIGSVPVYATEGVGELTFGGAFLKILEEMMV